ncbi:NAD(P)-dependent oxidoreductase [Phytohabitans sp. ZYX-F-186]|uniref:NAD(P)-dependent oxidoreductase n=1 Tax=Phytohabitans maris TaxID=3071409 RepID=A0ABU0ZTV3_9ACTN|nr:NAD(P)-dependent oxidoreductase [Phytohabitans sp. ZYX-F-186]MDQ7910459.1 NAD(P)-dependent oxidoreductase [Phytohabitans sp. ZYX-F-186]
MIGFVGLGNMGGPMARRLVAAGHDLCVYDVAPAARERFAGSATVAGTVTDVSTSDTVLLMLPDSAVVERVLLGDGLLDRLAPGTLLVDMSSSDPNRTRALAATAAERGVTLVDAPVSGGVSGAQAGTLTIMVGGPAAAFTKLGPFFAVLGANVVHAGEVVGAGHAVKALNNLMSAAHLMVASEALLAGQAFGLDPRVMLDIVNASSGRSGSTETKWPKFVLPGTYDSGFGLRLMLKDMGIALGLQESTGTPAAVSAAAVAAWADAAEALPPDADHTEVAAWLAARTKTDGHRQGSGPC